MRPAKIAGSILFFVIALAVAADAVSGRAHAQGYYQCPPGYYLDPVYGCLPLNYFYGPPYYAYPDYGFGFFYGGTWGPGWGRGVAPRGGRGVRGHHR